MANDLLLPRARVLWQAYQVCKSVIECEALFPTGDLTANMACDVAERLALKLDFLTPHAVSRNTCSSSSPSSSPSCSRSSDSVRSHVWDDGVLDDNEALVTSLVLRQLNCGKVPSVSFKSSVDGTGVGSSASCDAAAETLGRGICEGMLSVVLERSVSLEEEEPSDVLLGTPIHKVTTR
jgi:hypothetical protein